jgi:hypothetical protein
MAGDWFPMGYWRSRTPEVVTVASRTKRDRHQVLGLLCDLWSYVSSESVDGTLRGVRLCHLSSVVGADDAFWRAVAEVNWLAEDEAGIVVPGWEHWLSESAKKRSRERVKKKRQRAKRPDSVPDLSPKCPPEKGTTLHNSTLHNNTEDKTPSPVAKKPRQPRALVPAKPRERDHLFDAVAEVSGSDPKVAGSHVAKISNLLAKAEPPYSPDEVREFGHRFWEFCPWAKSDGRDRPTLGEIEKNIGKLRVAPVTPLGGPAQKLDPIKQRQMEALKTMIGGNQCPNLPGT